MSLLNIWFIVHFPHPSEPSQILLQHHMQLHWFKKYVILVMDLDGWTYGLTDG